jgi:hypothetical protein
MPSTVKNKKTLEETEIENPWRNAYWFARMLISGDKYGGIGKDSKLLSEICLGLRKVLEDKKQSADVRLNLSKNVINRLLETRYARVTGRSNRIKLFIEDLSSKLNNIEDVAVFILTAENIMIPINESLKGIPNDDKKFTEALAKGYLDKLGDRALATVVNIWDDAGVAGCLTAERIAVVREFTRLRREVERMGEHETNLILTAFVQEFERRLGQKRKGRAGGSLEDVATFLFHYYQIEAENKPEHFQADIEVDKWVRTKDKWLIGISCKRTLRERWKQVSSATSDILGKFKIKQIWHLTTYDEDLSDEKLTLLGGQRHIFYLRDESRRLEHAQKHIGMRDYVRPMSKFITDLKHERGG